MVNPLGNDVTKAAVAARVLVKPDLVAFAEDVRPRSDQKHTLETDSCHHEGRKQNTQCNVKNKGFVLSSVIVKDKSIIPFSPMYPRFRFPFLVDLPTLQMDSMFFSEKPFSLLKMRRVAGAPVAVMSSDVMTNSRHGSTPSGYSLSSAFCEKKIQRNRNINV